MVHAATATTATALAATAEATTGGKGDLVASLAGSDDLGAGAGAGAGGDELGLLGSGDATLDAELAEALRAAREQLQQEMDARVAIQNCRRVLTTEVKPVHPVLHCGVVAAALREAHQWLIRRIGAIVALLLRCSAGRGSGGRLRTTPLWLWLLPL